MNSIGELDVLVAAAVAEAAAVLRPRVGEAGESAPREALVAALRSGLNLVADAERAIPIAEFQGVGPVDVVLRREPGADLFGLIECKWSGDPARVRWSTRGRRRRPATYSRAEPSTHVSCGAGRFGSPA